MRDGIVHLQALLYVDVPLEGIYIGELLDIEATLIVDQDGDLVGVDVPGGTLTAKSKVRVDRLSTSAIASEILASARKWMVDNRFDVDAALAEFDSETPEYTDRRLICAI